MTVFYPPHIEFSGQPEISIYAPTGSEPSAVIHWAAGNEHITGVAQADERIAVYLKAKEMLTGYRHAVANHAGIGEYVNGTAHVAEDTAPGRVKLCRCDRDPFPHTPWPGCPEWKIAEGLPAANAAILDAAAKAKVECGASHRAPLGFGGKYICTEPVGHEPSDHVAMGGDVECDRWPAAEGLPVAEDDGGDGDDTREPYCTVCGSTLTAKGEHRLYPDGAIVAAHETVLGWRDPAGVLSGEDAQSAEVRRIGKLHTDGHITDAECQQMVDKVLGDATGEHA